MHLHKCLVSSTCIFSGISYSTNATNLFVLGRYKKASQVLLAPIYCNLQFNNDGYQMLFHASVLVLGPYVNFPVRTGRHLSHRSSWSGSLGPDLVWLRMCTRSCGSPNWCESLQNVGPCVFLSIRACVYTVCAVMSVCVVVSVLSVSLCSTVTGTLCRALRIVLPLRQRCATFSVFGGK